MKTDAEQNDAPSDGIGTILTQQHGEKVICFLLERNYSTTERKCLAVIWSVEKLQHYLESTRFTVVTDHASLLYLHRLKDPIGRLARSVPVSVDSVDSQTSDPVNVWYLRMKERVLNRPDKFLQWRIDKLEVKRREGFRKMFHKVKQRIEAAQERNRSAYDLRRRRRPTEYQIGDKGKVLSDVTKRIKTGLCFSFTGPFAVSRKVGSWTYEHKDDTGRSIGIWHLKPVLPVNNN
ncbi:hypothetical protein ILUMI_25759 [Ignelater luminosus]|uniref:Reverse transcriptase RNase H-like domain-containing protein n=1 Tax=Ignelater luminosus TaxID=2038154 RepID=A0A8K0FW51_IGNLU|nr:hypothetical protein ILUMI_25759 [Ignelater luminosus]